MTRVLLLNYNDDLRNADNWGSVAMLHALRRLLEVHIPDIDLRWLPHSWLVRQYRRLTIPPGSLFASDRHLPPFTHLLSRRFSRVVDFFPTIADDFERLADRWLGGAGGAPAHDFIAAARDADVVVHNGEHQIYRNSREGCRALFLLWLARTRLGKPSCEINHTAHLTGVQPIMPAMVRLTYPVLDAVTAREPASLDNLEALGVTNAELVPDPVFFLDPASYSDASVSAWRRSTGLDGQRYFCLSASALPMSAPDGSNEGALVRLVTELKRIVPQAVLVAKDRHCRFLADVAERTASLYFGPEHVFSDLWHLFRGAEFLVSGHYHYLIMASMVGCPFIPLTSTTHKIDGLCRLLEWHRPRPYDATFLTADTDAIIADAKRLASDRQPYADHLIRRAMHLGSQAVRNATLVRDAATSSSRLARTAPALTA